MVNFSSKHLTLKITEGPSKGPVIIVSKKVAALAVTRNKIKRQLRELYKAELFEQYKILPSQTPVIYTRKGVAELSFSQLKEEIVELKEKIIDKVT